MEKIFNKRNVFITVFFVVLFKLYLSGVLELHPDEAYYWMWSCYPAAGYYDHSPMVAYFIKLTTLFCDHEFFVRLSSIIVTLVLSVLVWLFSKKLFNETIASACVIVLNTMPLMFVGSVIMTPDTPLFLFWGFAVYFTWRAFESEKTYYWYIIGIFFGLALLSKYTAVLFVPCLFIYMLLDKKTNRLKNRDLYLMFVIAFLVFLPTFLWNAQNGFISFFYQLKNGLHNSEFETFVSEYLGSQALMAGPVVFIAGIFAGIKYFRQRDSKTTFLLSFSFPVILFFVFTALKKKPGANWPAFAYFTFAVFCAKYLLETKNKKKCLIIGTILNVVLSLLVGFHAARTTVPVYKFSKKAAIADATNWFYGWKALGEDLRERNLKYVVTNSHQWGAEIAYYTRGRLKVFLDEVPGDRFNQFMFWNIPPDTDKSKTALVRIDNKMNKDFSGDFETFIVYRKSFPIRQYGIKETNGYTVKTDINKMRTKT